MNSLFDSAGLAIVAYAEVAADGTSTVNNSGVTTTKTAAVSMSVSRQSAGGTWSKWIPSSTMR